MALADTITLLSRTPLFRLLDHEALRLIAFMAESRRLRADEALFRRGERSDGGYVVLDGELDITAADESLVGTAGPGVLIGQLALFVRMQRPSSAIAREGATVLRISPTLMRRILQEFPAGAAAIRDALAENLGEFSDELEKIRRVLLAVGS